ncbi:MAG: hypothetical protein V1676_03740 [Candidatus Diapherotrites archaeon]
MELFKIGYGPWKKLFEGDYQGHTMGIYTNPESVVLAVIYEIEGNKATGAVVELFKTFFAIGETEAFVETLPREVIMLSKHSEKESFKFMLIASKPEYVRWSESVFIEEVDRLLKRLNTSATMIKDVSKAYDLQLKELGECSETVKGAFFAQPLLIPSVASSVASAPAFGAGTEEESAPNVGTGTSKGEIIMGLTKERKEVLEPLGLFTKTAVFGGTPKDRKHVLHILAESAMLSNVPVIVFDWNNEFSGLGQSSESRDELEKYKVDAEPIGLPLKHFRLFNEVVVDLNMINPEGISQMFGIGRNVVSKIISDTLRANTVKGITDLGGKVNAIEPGEEPSAYQIRRAVRVLRVIGLRYPDLFEGSNDMEEMSKGWMKGLGRAALLHLHTGDARVNLLVTHSILRSLQKYYAKQGETRKVKAMLIMPECGMMFPRNPKNILSQEAPEVLVDISGKYGIGYAISDEKPIDLATAVIENTEAKIEIVKGNDAGVQLRDRKSYRVFIRPALSMCTEK